MPASDRQPLRHDAIFYDDEAFLASSASAFVREGVEQGDVVMVNTGRNSITSVLRGLFEDSGQVVFADKPAYSTPAGALEGYRRVMEEGLAAGVRGYRAMGFIDFDSSPLPWQEWLRYEAAVNSVFAAFPFRTLCPYDTSRVDPEIIDAMRRAHSGLVEPDGWRLNEAYVAPAELVVAEGLMTPRHPLQDTAPRMVLEPSRDLAELRMELYGATMFTGLSRRKVDDFVAAVSEIAMNAHRHGGPPLLRLWAAHGSVLCTVTDDGGGIADPLVGYTLPPDPSQGLGLWAARQLCDVLDFEQDERGFTVRVASFL